MTNFEKGSTVDTDAAARSDHTAGPDAEPDRSECFKSSGAAAITLEIGPGRAKIVLTEGADEVSARIRPHGGNEFSRDSSLTAALSWLSDQAVTAGFGDLTADVVSTAVEAVLVDYESGRLTVLTPKDLPLRAVPLRVDIAAPAGSTVSVRSGSAGVRVDGPCGSLEARTGSGMLTASHCSGAADVRTGSGDIRLETVLGALQAKSGSGDVKIGTVGGRASVRSGAGAVRLREVAHDLHVQTGSGDVWVGDASGGRLDLTSGAGELRIGVRPGVLAELDLRSAAGKAHSDLPVGTGRPAAAPTLVIKGRTGSGNVHVGSAG